MPDVLKGPQEDRCTNALVWLLQRCSPEMASQVLSLAGLTIREPLEPVQGRIQESFPRSRPDAILEFQGPQYVVIETKIHPGMCSIRQLRNHYFGAARRFGEERISLLFLSVERSAPREITLLSKRFPGKIFFLAWQQVLLFLQAKRATLDYAEQVFLGEFFACIRAAKLWRLFAMTTDELKSFLAHFPDVWTKWVAAENALYALLKVICTQAVASSGESSESETDDFSDQLPCLYSALKIRGWHTTSSAYVFINAALGKVGVVLTGYQDDRKQKEKLLDRWRESFKNLFAADSEIRTFAWESDDEAAGDTGYFSPVQGTAGQVFDPSKIEVFTDYFYWGYWHDLDVSDSGKVSQLIAEDFNKLLTTYGSVPPAARRGNGVNKVSKGTAAKVKTRDGKN
jgi:hypothetical protein